MTSKKKAKKTPAKKKAPSAFAAPPPEDDPVEHDDASDEDEGTGDAEDGSGEFEVEESGVSPRSFEDFQLPPTSEEDDEDEELEFDEDDESSEDDEEEEDEDEQRPPRRDLPGAANNVRSAIDVALGNQRIESPDRDGDGRPARTGAIVYVCYPVKGDGKPDPQSKVVVHGNHHTRATVAKAIHDKAPYQNGTWEVHVYHRKMGGGGKPKDIAQDLFHVETSPDMNGRNGHHEEEDEDPIAGLNDIQLPTISDIDEEEDDDMGTSSAVRAMIETTRGMMEFQQRQFNEMMNEMRQQRQQQPNQLAGIAEAARPVLELVTPIALALIENRAQPSDSAAEQVKMIRETMQLGMDLRDKADRPKVMDFMMPMAMVAVAALAPNPKVQKMVTKLFGGDEEGEEEESGEHAELPAPASRRNLPSSKPPVPPPPPKPGTSAKPAQPANVRPKTHPVVAEIIKKVQAGGKMTQSEFRVVNLWSFIDGLIATGKRQYARSGYWANRFAHEIDDVAVFQDLLATDTSDLVDECLSVGDNIVAFIRSQVDEGEEFGEEALRASAANFIDGLKRDLLDELKELNDNEPPPPSAQTSSQTPNGNVPAQRPAAATARGRRRS